MSATSCASKLVVVAVSAIACCLCVYGEAFAAPLPRAPLPPGQEAFPTPLSEERAGAFAVQDYARKFGVTQAEAHRRLSLQTKTPDMRAKLIRRLGGGFGQLYFDNDEGRYVLAIGPRGRSADARKGLDQLGQPTAAITRMAVNHAQLSDGIRALGESLRDAVRPGTVQLGLGERGADLTVAAGATADERRRIDALVAGSSIPVRVTDSTSQSLLSAPAINCTFPFCDTLVAGVQWRSWVTQCTLAFYSGPINVYYPRFMSAGHCALSNQPPGSPPWWSCKPGLACPTPPGPPNLGAGYQQAFHYGANYGGTHSDNMVLYFNGEARWPISPGWWNWQHHQRVALTNTHDPNVGETVCQGGAVTHIACGQVERTDWDGWYGPTLNTVFGDTYVNGMISVRDICVNFGDSGGPVTMWHGAWAVGITSGGATPAASGCAYTIMRAEPISRAQAQYGIYVYGG
jgi:hypothetical protein